MHLVVFIIEIYQAARSHGVKNKGESYRPTDMTQGLLGCVVLCLSCRPIRSMCGQMISCF